MIKDLIILCACVSLLGCARTTENDLLIRKTSDSEDGTAHSYKEQTHLIDAVMRIGFRKLEGNTNSAETFVGSYGQVSNILLTTSIHDTGSSGETEFVVKLHAQYPNTKSAWADWNRISSLVKSESDETIWTKPNHGLESTSAPPAAGTLETHP